MCHFVKWKSYLVYQNKIKGPDNPTCQRFPTSSKKKVKMAWGKQDKNGEGLVWSELCVEKQVRVSCVWTSCVACMYVCMVCMYGWMGG